MNDVYSATNVAAIIDHHAALHPAAPAILMHDGAINYRELLGMINAVAHRLLDHGILPGQIIGLSMVQTPLNLITQLALARIGAVSICIHPLLPVGQRELAAKRFGVSMIVSGAERFKLDEFPFIHLAASILSQSASQVPIYNAGSDHPFRIVLTSGTSGNPKGVLYTHGYTLERMRVADYVTADSRLLPMDLNYAIGFIPSLCLLAEGGSIIFPKSVSPSHMILVAQVCGATEWWLSPSMAEQVAEQLHIDDIHFPKLEHLSISGSAPSERLIDLIIRRMTPNLDVLYGMTEIGVVSRATLDILKHFPGCSGHPLDNVRVEVVDEDDHPLPPGQSGRLRIRANRMVDGYYQSPEQTLKHFRNGWYYPGDCGSMDAEGLLFLSGREDDVLNVDGAKVNPIDIESVLRTYPSVRDVASFTFVEQSSQQTVLAAAFLADQQLSIDELTLFSKEQLGPMSPLRFIQIPTFPRNANGKLLREELAEIACAALSQLSVG